MFMFAYAVVIISIVGLFLQVTNALALHFASQQTGVGQQLISWQEMAREYACTPVSLPTGTSDSGVITGIRAQRTTYTGRTWDTAIFDGTYGGASARLVLSYISPTADYGGYGAGEVARQFRASLASQGHRFTPTYDGGTCPDRCIDLIISNDGANYSIVISGLPTGGADAIPANVSALVSSVSCP
jgi:hypothetical protein